MAIVGGFYEAGQEQEIIFAPGQLAMSAKIMQGQAAVSKSLQDFRGSEAEIQLFIDSCKGGSVNACQALMIRAKDQGEPCAAEGVAALYPGGISCDCDTNKCTPTNGNGTNGGLQAQLEKVPTWAWVAGAAAIGAFLWMRR